MALKKKKPTLRTAAAHTNGHPIEVIKPARRSTARPKKKTSNKPLRTLAELNAKMDSNAPMYDRAFMTNTRRLTGKPSL